MAPKDIILPQIQYSGTIASEAHFGANVLMTMNFLDEGGNFDRLLKEMGVVNLRFPGGSIAEDLQVVYGDRIWDVDRPNGVDPTDPQRLVTYPAFLDYANDNGAAAMIVIPTEPFLEPGEYGDRDMAAWGLYRIMSRADMLVDQVYGDARIDTLSIGNEFWYNNDRMTAVEYGRLANEMSVALQYVFDRHAADLLEQGIVWDDPDIAVQAAQGADVIDNLALIAELDADARAAIDTVETHFYPRMYSRIDDFDKTFDRIEDFKNAPGFGDLKTYISEWNIKADSTTDLGLLQGTGMLEMMEVMLEEGVDSATIWGLQYTKLATRLSTLCRDPSDPSGYDYHISASGIVFDWMTETIPGTQVIELGDLDPTGGIEGHAFGNDDHVAIYLSSMTDQEQEIILNIRDLVPDYEHFWGQQLHVIDNPATTLVNEGDPLNPGNLPAVQTFNGSLIDADGNIHLTFQPYEIMQLNFQLNDEGVHLYGQSTAKFLTDIQDDNLVGGAGGDLIEGNIGDDILRGLGGHDVIYGGSGDDYLNGGTGNDLVDGGTGLDTVEGHTGDDTLVGLSGDTTMTGGSGVDHFVMTTDSNTIITDFGDVDGQTLSFADYYSDLSDVMSRVTTDGNDLLITHDEGFFTRLVDMAGREDELAGSLSDFMDDSPVQELVDRINTPVPDGSIDPNPPPGTYPDLLREDDLAYVQDILKLDPDQVAELAANFTPEAFDEFLNRVDPDSFFYCMRPEELAAFMNGLDDTMREALLDDVSSEGVAFKLLRLQEDVGGFLSQLDPDSLEDVINLIDDADAKVIAPRINDATRQELQGRVDSVIADDENHPLATFFIEDEDPDQDPDPDTDPDNTPDPVGSSGCFVATAAYGDLRHPEVEYLRLVRDMILINHAWGRVFIKVYWTVGPKLARFVAPRPMLRRVSVAVLHGIVTRLQRRRVLKKYGVLPMERLRGQR